MNRAGEDGGFLYVEVLVALAVFSISLLALLPMLAVSAHEALEAELATVATGLANAKADELSSTELSGVASAEETVSSGRARLRRSWRIERDTPHAGLTTVLVTVQPVRRPRYGPGRAVTVKRVLVN